MSDDDDIPDLLDKATGEVVKHDLKNLTPMACASPAVEPTRKISPKVTVSSVDPETGRDTNGYTELHWAVYTGNETRASELLEEERFDVDDCANEKKQTPLLWAAVMGRAKLCHLLVEHGASLRASDQEGFTALSLAAQNGHVLLVHLLCELGADTGVVDADGHNLIHWSVYRQQPKVVAYLLRFRNVNVNAADRLGATPLHWAAMRGATKCVSPLLEHGARIDVKDSKGKTPLDIANANKFNKIVREIEESTRPETMRCGLDYSKQLFYFPMIGLPIAYAVSMSLSTLFVIPWLFGMWYLVKSGLAFKHVQGPGGFRSAAPYGVMCATCVGVYYYNLRYIVWTLDQSLVHLLFHVSGVAMFAFLIPFKNVGFVPRNQGLTTKQWSRVLPDLFCPFCCIQQPIRAHHCRRCNRCVARFDHHCPWVDSCVGYGNNHVFIPMITCGAICHTIFAVQGYQFAALQFGAAESLMTFWTAWGPMVIFWLFEFGQLFGEWFLVYRQVQGATRNLTTWEQMGLMQHGDRPNPYDRGLERNLKQFFRLGGPLQIDYMTKFEGEMFDFEPAEA